MDGDQYSDPRTMDIEGTHPAPQTMEDEVGFEDQDAVPHAGANLTSKRASRTAGTPTSLKGYVAVPFNTEDDAIRPRENYAYGQDAQPTRLPKETEPGTLSSQAITGEHSVHPRYGTVPLGNPSAASRWTQLSTETWFWELCGTLVSLIGVASICGVLLAYDDKAAPRLPHHITLNAVVSILGTVSKTTLAFSLAAVISQKKWLRYQEKPQKLQHLQSFDDASRGPYGSLKLVLAPSMEFTTRVVAIVLLASIATDPFFQQLLSYPARQVASIHLTASINETLGIPSYHTTHSSRLSSFAPDTISSAVGAGIYNQELTPRVPPLCPTGDCVWKPYHALSFCSKCEDITDRVSVTGTSSQDFFDDRVLKLISNLNVTYLDGLNSSLSSYEISHAYKNLTGILTLRMPTARIYQSENTPTELTDASEGVYSFTIDIPYHLAPDILTPSYNSQPSKWSLFAYEITVRRRITAIKQGIDNDAVAGIKSPLAAFSSIMLDESGDLSEVLECAVSFCVHEYNTVVKNGTFTSYSQSTSYGTPYNNIGVIVDARLYAVSALSILNMNAGLCDAALGTITGTRYPIYSFHHEEGGMHIDGVNGATGSTLAPSSLEIAAIDDQRNFSKVLENIASSLNNYLQRYATDQVPGEVLVQETYVHVRWPWLVLPIALVLIGILTLLHTIWQTKRQKAVVWKSSILPLLYRGLVQLGSIFDDKAASPSSRMNTVAAMYEDTKGVRVRLMQEGEMGEWRLKEVT